jgi:hypothetical protein
MYHAPVPWPAAETPGPGSCHLLVTVPLCGPGHVCAHRQQRRVVIITRCHAINRRSAPSQAEPARTVKNLRALRTGVPVRPTPPPAAKSVHRRSLLGITSQVVTIKVHHHSGLLYRSNNTSRCRVILTSNYRYTATWCLKRRRVRYQVRNGNRLVYRHSCSSAEQSLNGKQLSLDTSGAQRFGNNRRVSTYLVNLELWLLT